MQERNIATTCRTTVAMVTIRTILIATDLSPFSQAAYDYAMTLRLAFGARLHLLYVMEEGKGADASRRTQSVDEALSALRALAARSTGAETDAVCSVRRGAAAVEICRYARDAGADMIVMTTHGYTGLRHVLSGSVAERVVRRSSTPVLTIKPRMLTEFHLQDEDVERQLHLC